MVKSVVLVEDNPSDAKLTLRALKRSGIANPILHLTDGDKARIYIESLHAGEEELPALVLLDLNLPKVSGLDLLAMIKQHDRSRLVPVVILTSSKEDEDLVRSYYLGANSYIRKPVNFDRFVEAAQQLGMYWLMLNELPSELAESGPISS